MSISSEVSGSAKSSRTALLTAGTLLSAAMAAYIARNIFWKALSRVSRSTRTIFRSLTALIASSVRFWEASKASRSCRLALACLVSASLMSFLVDASVAWDCLTIFSRRFVKSDCIDEIFVCISVFSSEVVVPRVSVSLGFCCWVWFLRAFFSEGCPPTQAGKSVSYTIWGERLFVQAFLRTPAVSVSFGSIWYFLLCPAKLRENLVGSM